MWVYFRQLFLFLTLGLSVLGCQAQQEHPQFLLRGFVLGADTSNTIPLANILNKANGKRYISNRYGAFGIYVDEFDTLVFTVIGYQNQELPVRKFVIENRLDPIKVRLRPITYRLKQVDISSQKRKQDSLARRAAVTLRTSPLLNNYEHVESWMSGSQGSPLTSLFAGSNAKLQEYNKLFRLMELYREQQFVDEKYNNKLIIRATGIAEKQVPDFKRFCNLPHYFILSANDYDLVLAIRECYKDYVYARSGRGH